MKCYLEIIRKLVKENKRLKNLIHFTKDTTVKKHLLQKMKTNEMYISSFKKECNAFISNLSDFDKLAITCYYFEAKSWPCTAKESSNFQVDDNALRMQITRACEKWDKK